MSTALVMPYSQNFIFLIFIKWIKDKTIVQAKSLGNKLLTHIDNFELVHFINERSSERWMGWWYFLQSSSFLRTFLFILAQLPTHEMYISANLSAVSLETLVLVSVFVRKSENLEWVLLMLEDDGLTILEYSKFQLT